MAATRWASASLRTSAVTSWPCSCNSVSMCDPMKPVEPVSVTFIMRYPPVLIVRAAHRPRQAHRAVVAATPALLGLELLRHRGQQLACFRVEFQVRDGHVLLEVAYRGCARNQQHIGP